MSIREITARWLVFAGAFGVSLVPGWLALSVPWLGSWFPRLANAALIWLIVATVPAGLGRIDNEGEILLPDSGMAVALIFWAVAALGFALVLHRLRIAHCSMLAVPLILAMGWGVTLLLAAFGYSVNIMP